MLPLLIDQDLNHVILRGLLLRIPTLDFVTAHQAGLNEVSDSDLLTWAAHNKRVVITHDRRTMPYHAAQLLEKGEQMAGVLIVPRQLSLSQVIDELEIIVSCSQLDEWDSIIKYLPL